MTFVIDICDTLFNSNTTFDFVKFVVTKKQRKRWMFTLITSHFSPVFLGLALLNKIFRVDLHRKLAVRLLKNRHRAELELWAKEFYQHHLTPRRNQKVWALVNERTQNDRVILLSSTLYPIAQIIAESNGFEFRATTLKYSPDDRFTGELTHDLTGIKHQELHSLGVNPEDLTVVTDNLSDVKLLAIAKRKFAVVNQPKTEAKWQLPNVNFIRLYE